MLWAHRVVIKSTRCAVLTSDQWNSCFLIPGLAPSHEKHKTDAVLQQGQGYQRDVINSWLLCSPDTRALLITKDSWPWFLMISMARSELSLEKYRHMKRLEPQFALRLFDVDATDSGTSEGKGARACPEAPAGNANKVLWAIQWFPIRQKRSGIGF